MKAMIFSAAVLAAATSAQAATLTFTESEFAPGSFTSTTIAGPANGQAASTSASVGQPAPSLFVTTQTAAITDTAHMLTGATVDMSAFSIDSIDFSLDFRPISAFGQGQGFGLIVEQGGTFFTAIGAITGSSTNPIFQPFSTTGIVSADFSATSPDFSLGADDISLGLWTYNQGGNTIIAAYDNISITVNATPATPVPLPAGLPLLLAGLLGLAALQRRRPAA